MGPSKFIKLVLDFLGKQILDRLPFDVLDKHQVLNIVMTVLAALLAVIALFIDIPNDCKIIAIFFGFGSIFLCQFLDYVT